MSISRKVQGKDSCEVCGKEQEHYFEVHLGGERHVFDSFECAINGLMPRCGLCGGLVAHSGVMVDGVLYCGQSCAGFYNLRGPESPL